MAFLFRRLLTSLLVPFLWRQWRNRSQQQRQQRGPQRVVPTDVR